jgi:hypothetical protein
MMQNFQLFSENHSGETEDFLWLYSNNKYYKLEIETPLTLEGRISSHINANNCALLNPYIIVIPDMEMHYIVNAISKIIANNLLDSYTPLHEVTGLVEIIIE